ncbi:MAG: hypothetical protein ACXVPQ_05825 [Bacteroidia bacterium]
MMTSDKTEPLSPAEIQILELDRSSLKKAARFSLIAVPIAILFLTACFYFDWDGVFKFISVACTGGAIYILLISTAHTRKLSADLRSGTKTIAPFLITRKKVMGLVDITKSYENRGLNNRQKARREIKVSDARIRQAIADKAELEKDPVRAGFAKMGMNDDDNFSKNTYHFTGRFTEKAKDTELLVPIEYYLTGLENETVNISYAVRSKKVFKIEKSGLPPLT